MARRFPAWRRTDTQIRHEIDDEIRAHLESRIEHLVSRGVPVEVARDEAVRRFGNVEAGRAALMAQALGHRRRLRWTSRLEQVAQDLRYIARALAARPGFAAAVIATIALGVGVNAAVFRLADQVLFRPPALVEDPGAVRRVEALVGWGGGAPQRATMFSYPDARVLVDSRAFGQSAMYSPARLRPDEQGREVAVAAADAGFLPLLGVAPAMGRTFHPSEAEPGASHGVALVSFDFWRTAFGTDAWRDDRAVVIGGRRLQVIGVLPRGFTGIDLDPVDVWLPLGDADLGRQTLNGAVIPWYRTEMLRALRVLGRHSPRAPDEPAIDRLTAALAARDRAAGGGVRSAVLHPIVPVGDPTRQQDASRLLARLAVATAIVLVLACGNATHLLLARTLRRRREIGIRVAVGASRSRVARLLLIESVSLAMVGGAMAGLAGHWTTDALRQLVLPDARWTASSLDARTLVFTAVLAVITGVAIGLLPALQAARPDVIGAIQNRPSRAGGARRTRSLLIVVQTALSLPLLVACGLLVLSLARLNAVPLGFEPEGLLTLGVRGFDTQGAGELTADAGARLRSAPGVVAVAAASSAPFGSRSMTDITVPGSSFEPASDADLPYLMTVGDNYFEVMGTRVLDGRRFGASDVTGADPVAIVNASMARRYWGDGSPFASCIQRAGGPCARVVGVVEDMKDTPSAGDAAMRFYLPLRQTEDIASALVVRAAPERTRQVAALARSLVPDERRVAVEVVADRIRQALRPWRIATMLFVLVGGIALALSCLGIYSVTSVLVTERIHEFGVRVALGASQGGLVRLVLEDGLRLVLAGAALGIAAALTGGRLLGALLFDVALLEPRVYVAGLACLAATSMAAMLPPVFRATRVDPLTALREP